MHSKHSFLLNSLLTFSILLSGITAVRTRSRANYGEFCDNRAIRCDSTLSLTCQNQTCVCLKPETMIYDSSRKSCAALAGEKCKFTVMEEYRSWHEEISCVSNAHCDVVQSVCTCDRNFIELSNGTCIPKKNYNETCETSADCKQDVSLICRDSKCICNQAISEYSEEMNQCVGLANEPCVNDLCTANAICREEPRRIYYGGTSVEIEVSSDEDYSEALRDPGSVGRCQCRTAFGVTAGGKCLLGYGGKCDHEQAKCMEWLRCKEGTCVCQYSGHQFFDKVSESCLSYVGGPCTPDDVQEENNTSTSSNQDTGKNLNKIGCILGAVCSKLKDSPRYQCVCPEGLIENPERSCDLDYGQKCRTQQMSTYSLRHATPASISTAKCDRIGKLFCIDGTCQCEDALHIYDKESRSCKGGVGALCNTKEEGACAPNAHCKRRRGGDETLEGVCTCREFSKEVGNGTCSNPTPPQRQMPDAEKLKAAGISLKSGGSARGHNHNHGLYLGDNYNATRNSIWAFFEDTEEER